VPVVASKEDSAAVKSTMAELATQFASAPVDSLFVRQFGPAYNKRFRSPPTCPSTAQAAAPGPRPRVRPLRRGGTYSLTR
jgi:peptidyl-prolyl cis-trans isomerase D